MLFYIKFCLLGVIFLNVDDVVVYFGIVEKILLFVISI